MPMRLSSDRVWHRLAPRGWSGHRREIDTALKLAVAVAVASIGPLPLFLPVLSMMLLAIGFWTAGSALLRGERRQTPGYSRWDEAGILVFLGFAAAILSEPADALRYLEQLELQR